VSRRRFLPVLGAAVGLAGFLAAPSTGTRQQRGPELSVVRVMARIGNDTVLSTGYIVDAEQGRVLTTAHSLWGATSLKMQTGLAVVHARVLARDPCDDIAIAEMEPRLSGYTQLPGGGSRGVVALEPRGPTLSPLTGVTGVRVRATSAGALAGHVGARDTGAPVLDAAGRVVGIVRSGQGRSVIVPWRTISSALGELTPGKGTDVAGWRQYYRCSGRMQAYERREHRGYRLADARLNSPVPATRLPGTQNVDAP